MGLKSQLNGFIFESKLCEYLSNDGYYVIYNNKGIVGSQPCDIVAIKNNIATLIECKNLENQSGKFPLSRIESNQWLAYKKLKECHNSNMVLSILWDNKIYFVNFDLLHFFNKSIDLKTLEPNIKNWSE